MLIWRFYDKTMQAILEHYNILTAALGYVWESTDYQPTEVIVIASTALFDYYPYYILSTAEWLYF